jgi:hypothetical protein
MDGVWEAEDEGAEFDFQPSVYVLFCFAELCFVLLSRKDSRYARPARIRPIRNDVS